MAGKGTALWEENKGFRLPVDKAMPGPGEEAAFLQLAGFRNSGGRETSLLPFMLHAGK